jgi:hypothetical protein
MELTRSLIAAATLVVVASSRADVGVVDVSDFGAVGDGVTDSIKGTQQNQFEHTYHCQWPVHCTTLNVQRHAVTSLAQAW